jgi:4-amino-4-deoxy-L-arabinose transferase-like glycosyltransferase
MNSPEAISASSVVKPRWEWPAVIGVMLVAAAFRLLALNDVPPGLHHDEVIIGQIAKDILRGQVSIYFTPGYGHEPLYHYVLAGMFAAIGANAFVLRLTSAFVALLGIAAAYRLTRRVFSPEVALGATAWMAVTLWAVFFARVGLRGILLPLLSTLTAYYLWKALNQTTNSKFQPFDFDQGKPPNSKFQIANSKFVLPGILLGLTLYTYQASRVFPIIFAVFALYLALLHRPLFRQAWRGLIVFFLVAAIVAAPLVIYLTVVNPAAEERLSDLSGPLNNLLAGDPSDVVRSTLNTLGMFSVMGDNVPIYNLSGRPVFPEPIGAMFFYAGLLLSVWRWRRPAHALMLIWFAISLAPAMVTPFSPNFVRTIASWPVPFVFCGMAMAELARFALRRFHYVSRFTFYVITVITAVLIFNAVLTARDYFLDWPRGDYVRFWQQTTWTQAARALDADPSTLPVAASGLSIQDLDPQTFDLLLDRRDVKVKWFDCRSAILYPGGAAARYLSPDFFPCDADLWAHYLPGAEVVARPRWPDSGNVIFTLHQFDPAVVLGSIPERFAPADLDGLQLLGWDMGKDEWRRSETVKLESAWKVTAPLDPPLKLFVHVTRPDGTIAAQFDGLDVGVSSLEPGDVFVQRHLIPLPPDASPGPYRILLGAYHPDTGARLTGVAGDQAIDSVVLGTLDVVE